MYPNRPKLLELNKNHEWLMTIIKILTWISTYQIFCEGIFSNIEIMFHILTWLINQTKHYWVLTDRYHQNLFSLAYEHMWKWHSTFWYWPWQLHFLHIHLSKMFNSLFELIIYSLIKYHSIKTYHSHFQPFVHISLNHVKDFKF
jgi:hypothetical protein